MPPAGKGKGKKTRGGGNLGTSTNLHQRRSRSRNTSPSSATAVSDTTFSSAEMSTSYQDIVDRYLTADSGIPQAVTLHQLTGDLRIMQENVKRRLALYEESVRSLDEKIIRKQEDMKRLRKADDDAKERRLKAAEEARKGKSPKRDGDKFKKKKDRYERETDGKRPPAHGAHQLPTQHAEVVIPVDGKRRKRKAESPGERASSRSPPMKKQRSESSDHQLEPMPAEIVYEPLEDDPTVYEIEEVTPDMSIDDRKRIYRVSSFPTVDLAPLQPGIPPDEDFSKGKAPNQVSLNAFHNMIEPYFRLFNEEDEAFLRERGDRVQPFIMPALGRHYKKVWAEEDGSSYAAFERPSPSPNEPRGSPERLSDNQLEHEDISVGPLLARVLAGMIPEEEPATVEETKPKETPMSNGIIANGDSVPNGESSATLTVSSSTNLTNVVGDPAAVKAQPLQKTDYAGLEQRLLQEMKYIGLIPLNAPEPDWNERQDDEVSARLRLLQKQLHKTAVGVGAMKARLAELLEPQIAYQEYSTIHDDLDRQLETAYSKRTRTIKAKKKKVGHHLANGANAAGVAQSRIGIGDVAKSIMEKRTKWHNEVGPVFDSDMRKLPKGSMFQDIDEYVKLEEEMFRAAMEEAQEAEADG